MQGFPSSQQFKTEENDDLKAAYDKPMEVIDEALYEIQQQGLCCINPKQDGLPLTPDAPMPQAPSPDGPVA